MPILPKTVLENAFIAVLSTHCSAAREYTKAQSITQAYLLTNHLGSIDTIFDENGTVLQLMSFSAWGEHRLPTIRQQMDGVTNRSYTGHEMIAFGIINMGGRLYDTSLG